MPLLFLPPPEGFLQAAPSLRTFNFSNILIYRFHLKAACEKKNMVDLQIGIALPCNFYL